MRLLHGVQIAHLLRPSEQLLAEMDLEGTAKSIGYKHPIVGLHMRGGDGCRYGIRARQFRCRALADYVPQLRAMAMKYGESFAPNKPVDCVRLTVAGSPEDIKPLPSANCALFLLGPPLRRLPCVFGHGRAVCSGRDAVVPRV